MQTELNAYLCTGVSLSAEVMVPSVIPTANVRITSASVGLAQALLLWGLLVKRLHNAPKEPYALRKILGNPRFVETEGPVAKPRTNAPGIAASIKFAKAILIWVLHVARPLTVEAGLNASHRSKTDQLYAATQMQNAPATANVRSISAKTALAQVSILSDQNATTGQSVKTEPSVSASIPPSKHFAGTMGLLARTIANVQPIPAFLAFALAHQSPIHRTLSQPL